MGGLNKVMIIGHLGADPELRYTTAGQAIASLRIATSESWQGKDGAKQEKTEWHKVVAFGKTAELANTYLKKGTQVYIEGRLQTRQWDDKDGNKHYITEIAVREMVFLGSKTSGGQQREKSERERWTGEPDLPLPPAEDQPNFEPMPDDDYPF